MNGPRAQWWPVRRATTNFKLEQLVGKHHRYAPLAGRHPTRHPLNETIHRRTNVPLSYLVIGSCLSHDVAKRTFGDSVEYRYLWRVSTPSLLNTLPVDRDCMPIELEASERKSLMADLYKQPGIDKELDAADVIIIDFVRDSYDFIILENGSIVTRGVEVEKYNLAAELGPHLVCHFGTRAHFEVWLQAISLLVQKLSALAKPVVYVRSRWMHIRLADWKYELNETFGQFEIWRRNFLMSHYQDIFESMLLPTATVRIPDWVTHADPRHVWGDNPIHLHPNVIAVMAESLHQQVKDNPLFDLRPLESKANDAVALMRSILSDNIIAVPEH